MSRLLEQHAEMHRYTRNHALTHRDALMIGALGLGGEAGEVQELVKKLTDRGARLTKERICEELGDVLWYVAEVAFLNGLSLRDVVAGNIAKLEERYPDGFAAGAAAAQTEVTE